jgi:hypothetical protein
MLIDNYRDWITSQPYTIGITHDERWIRRRTRNMTVEDVLSRDRNVSVMSVRKVLIYFLYIEKGLNHKQIGIHLGMPPNTVRASIGWTEKKWDFYRDTYESLREYDRTNSGTNCPVCPGH